MMGGDITIISELGKGTIFRVEVVIHRGKGVMVEQVEPPQHVIGLKSGQGPFRILVVDDKMENRQLLSEMLKLVGFETEEASNGEEAVAAFERWEPHLIMMDMRMPVMNGYEATRIIKAMEKGHKTPIIAITASAFDEDKKKVFESGVDGFIRKPFKDYELFDAIEVFLSVEYIYDKEPDHPELKEKKNITPEGLAIIPKELVDQMRVATVNADFDTLLELIAEVEKTSPQLAGQLSDLANNFEYDALLKMMA
jgi:CheY-like chemotaxis protein